MRNHVYGTLLHAILGGFAAWAAHEWIYGLVIIICFLAYEISEDWRIKDHAYIDIRGFLAGFVVGIVVIELVRLF
jgi:hypothetical protein